MDNPPKPKPRKGLYIANEHSRKPIPLPRFRNHRGINGNNTSSSEEVFKGVNTSSKDSPIESRNATLPKINKEFENMNSEQSDTESGQPASVANNMFKTSSWGEGYNKTRSVSMPSVNINLFESIKFHSPLLDSKKINKHLSEKNPLNQTYEYKTINSSGSETSSEIYANTQSYDEMENMVLNKKRYRVLDNHIISTYTTLRKAPIPLVESMNRGSLTSLIETNLNIYQTPDTSTPSRPELFKQNSLYENFLLPEVIPLDREQSKARQASKSTIYEFDPLALSLGEDKETNNLLLLESFLNSDTHGTIKQRSISDESVDDINENYFNSAPPPPERFDSLFSADSTVDMPKDSKDTSSKSSWFLPSSMLEKTGVNVIMRDKANASAANVSVMQRFSNILKLDNVLPMKSKPGPGSIITVERPAISDKPGTFYQGLLTRIMSGGVEDFFKNSQSRFCILSEQKFTCYSDSSNVVCKEMYPVKSIFSLQIAYSLTTSSAENLYCFEINIGGVGGLRNAYRKILFHCSSNVERRTWANKILEQLTSKFPSKYSSDFIRVGWCFLKEGVSADWHGAWIMLVHRILVYFTESDDTMRVVDLRKTRCVVCQEPDAETKICCPTDGSNNLLLDCPNVTLYLRMPVKAELKAWRNIIKLAIQNNGSHIHHQQLTKDDVPTIVDKCINFVYAHGCMSEGIYRRTGSNVIMAELLTSFRKDAWAVQLTKNTHTEHDVAGTLKRFFRDLPEPFIVQELHGRLIATHEINNMEERFAIYKCLLEELSIVARQTAQKLFAHLHFIHTLHAVNKMNANNLASIWGPTLMPAVMKKNASEMSWSQKEVEVICDFILHYPKIYQPTAKELEREKTMLRVLQQVSTSSSCAPQKQSGDIRIWVYIDSKQSGKCANISITPGKMCSDVCIELCSKQQLESHLLMMEEVICQETMRRIIHIDEIVLDVILRWGYWDDDDRKDNYLVVKENRTLQEIAEMESSVNLVCGELKFANEKAKSFKSHMFEVQRNKICYFKDKQGSHILGEWVIKDLLWYVGHETKRNPHSRWSITFIPKSKPKRSKDRPWFGSTIAGSVSEDQIRWMAALMFAEYKNLLPTPRLVVT